MEALHLAQKTAPENPKSTLLHKAARTMPGIIAGAADLDPAAVLTATVAGASFRNVTGLGGRAVRSRSVQRICCFFADWPGNQKGPG